MCGIIAAFHYGKKKIPVNDVVINMMQDQIERGEDGFGAIFIDDKLGFKVARATKQVKILVDSHFNPCNMMILHHRQPSASDNTISQTHPIVVEHNSLKFGYLVIHNGVIGNANELKFQHEKDGFVYTTDDQKDKRFNDSECLAIEMAKFIEKQTTIVGAKGSCAFVALQYDKKTKIALKVFYGRNASNPLNLAKSRDFLYLSSTGKGEEIKQDTLYSFDLNDFEIEKRTMDFATFTYPKERVGISRNIDDDDYVGYHIRNNIVEGFKDNEEPPVEDKMTDFEMEQSVEEGKDVIEAELELVYDDIKDKDKLFALDIDSRIKELVATIIIEIRNSYRIATEFHADNLMSEALEMKKEIDDKIAEEAETNGAQPAKVEKYYSK